MMKVSLKLEAINGFSKPIAAALRSIYALGRGVLTTNDFIKDARFHFSNLAGQDGIAKATRSVAYFRNQLSGLTGTLSVLKYATAGAVIGLGEEFVRGVFKAGGETDRMLVSLTKIEGGANQAAKAMRFIRQFAFGAGAGFSMPDIMKAYQQASSYQMNPQGGSLAAFADFAALHRRSIFQVMYAVKDAMEGTSTRPLANLGIKMFQGHGPDGTDTYLAPRSGGSKGFDRITSSKNPLDVLATVTRIMRGQAGGLAAAQAATVPGRIAQIKTLLYGFQTDVWRAGVGKWAMSRLNQFLEMIQRASRDGSWDKFATKISNFLTGTGDKLIRFFMQTDWNSVGRALSTLAMILGLLASALGLVARVGGGGLSGLLNIYLVTKAIGLTRALAGLWPVVRAGAIIMRGMIPIIFGFGRALVGLVIGGGPIMWIIAGIAALGVGIYLLWRNWSSVTGWIKHTWVGLPAIIMAAWRPLAGFFKALWAGISSIALPSWVHTLIGVLTGVTGRITSSIGTSAWAQMMQPAAPRAGPPRAFNPAGVARTSQVGGTMTVEFKNPPPGMKVTKLESAHPGFAIALKRGPVLASQ